MSIRPGTFTAAATALALLCALQAWSLVRAPALWFPAAVTVTLQPGEAIVLGQQELAAPQADQRHLALRRDANGRWLARNVSATRQLVIERGDVEQRLGSTVLRAGQQFQLGAAWFKVDAASAGRLALSAGPEHWEYDGATLLRNGRPQSACPDARPGARALALWNRWAPTALSVARPLTFGGNLYCDNRLGIANTAAGSATLARVRGRLILASGSPDGERAPLMLGASELAQAEEMLGDATALVAGRTRLAMSSEGDTLTLRPTRHVALFADAEARPPAHVAWRMQQRRLWSLPAAGAWLVMLALCTLLMLGTGLAWQRGRWPFARAAGAPVPGAAFGSALLAIAGIGALLMQRSGAPPGVGISMLLGWASLWCCLVMPGRLTVATTAATLLLALGLLAQLEMGLGAMESSWLRYFQKTVSLLAIGIGAGTWARLRLAGGASVVPQTRLEWALAALAACALGALLLQVLFGDETGVFDLQPVEFAKLALTALTAHCLALGMGWDAGTPDQASWRIRWFRLGAPALVFIALLGLALVQVDDYSPLILLVVWSMAMALAYALAARRHAITAGVAVLACLGVGAIVLLRGAGAADVAQWSFYADRFLVWLDPVRHPHTGQQLLLGAGAIAEGAWWGADHWLGISTFGRGAGSALHIPAVQDDFAPSFFLNRHGLASGLVLWALQALFLVGLLQTAAHAFAASRQARNFRQAWQGRFRCFVLCGGAAFVLGHLLLSWGTNLAIFPIMGQPMSFLSAGGSHLLFFICPLLAFSAISAQSIEENQSCRSMSNTKF